MTLKLILTTIMGGHLMSIFALTMVWLFVILLLVYVDTFYRVISVIELCLLVLRLVVMPSVMIIVFTAGLGMKECLRMPEAECNFHPYWLSSINHHSSSILTSDTHTHYLIKLCTKKGKSF